MPFLLWQLELQQLDQLLLKRQAVKSNVQLMNSLLLPVLHHTDFNDLDRFALHVFMF